MKIYKIKTLVHFYIFSVIISTILNFHFAVECQDLDFGLENQDPHLELWIRSHNFSRISTQDYFDTGLPLQKTVPGTHSFAEFPIFACALFFIYSIRKSEKNLIRCIQRWKSQRIKVHMIAYRFSIDY
jgi:hypothetical protein